MYIVMYRMRLGQRKSGWQAQPQPFRDKGDADNMCRELLSYSASKAQQEYSDAVAVFVDPE